MLNRVLSSLGRRLFIPLHSSRYSKMKKIISKLSKSVCTVVLLLGVYGMHFFLFESLLVSKTEQCKIPASQSSNNQDPSSAECRALFKYEGARQFLHVEAAPAAAILFHKALVPVVISLPTKTPGILAFVLPEKCYKRYSLNNVFLI